MKILIVGNFSNFNDSKEKINGQTIKSDLVYDSLNKLNYSLKKINTKNLKIKNLFMFKNEIKKADKIIFMLGINGMKILFPFIYIFSKLYNKDLYYIVIGGWLSEFTKKYKIHKTLLLRIKRILVECNGMKQELNKNGFKNITVISNFKNINFESEEKYKIKTEKFKIVFFSRVIREKGIFNLIDAIKKINNSDVELDIWGPLDLKEEKEYFFSLIEPLSNVIYKGVLSENIHNTLSKYDLLVFPTYYEGEGQAGIIIDSFIANLPILCSNWKYNEEFIENEKTGFLYDINKKEALLEKIKYILNNKEKLLEIRKNILKEKEKYTEKVFQKKIKQILECNL